MKAREVKRAKMAAKYAKKRAALNSSFESFLPIGTRNAIRTGSR